VASLKRAVRSAARWSISCLHGSTAVASLKQRFHTEQGVGDEQSPRLNGRGFVEALNRFKVCRTNARSPRLNGRGFVEAPSWPSSRAPSPGRLHGRGFVEALPARCSASTSAGLHGSTAVASLKLNRFGLGGARSCGSPRLNGRGFVEGCQTFEDPTTRGHVSAAYHVPYPPSWRQSGPFGSAAKRPMP
jgi:hypothetical protein